MLRGGVFGIATTTTRRSCRKTTLVGNTTRAIQEDHVTLYHRQQQQQQQRTASIPGQNYLGLGAVAGIPFDDPVVFFSSSSPPYATEKSVGTVAVTRRWVSSSSSSSSTTTTKHFDRNSSSSKVKDHSSSSLEEWKTTKLELLSTPEGSFKTHDWKRAYELVSLLPIIITRHANLLDNNAGTVWNILDRLERELATNSLHNAHQTNHTGSLPSWSPPWNVTLLGSILQTQQRDLQSHWTPLKPYALVPKIQSYLSARLFQRQPNSTRGEYHHHMDDEFQPFQGLLQALAAEAMHHGARASVRAVWPVMENLMECLRYHDIHPTSHWSYLTLVSVAHRAHYPDACDVWARRFYQALGTTNRLQPSPIENQDISIANAALQAWGDALDQKLYDESYVVEKAMSLLDVVLRGDSNASLHPNGLTFLILHRLLAKCQRLQAMEQIAPLLEKQKQAWNSTILPHEWEEMRQIRLKAWSDAGNPEKCLQIIESGGSSIAQPSDWTWLLRSWARSGHHYAGRTAEQIFWKKHTTREASFDQTSCNYVLTAYIQAGEYVSALTFFRALQQQQPPFGLKPDLVMYTSVLLALSRAASRSKPKLVHRQGHLSTPQLLDMAERLFAELIATGVRLDNFVFQTMQETWFQHNNPVRIEQLFQHCKREFHYLTDHPKAQAKLEPKQQMHLLRLRAWANVGHVKMTVRALHDMIDAANAPSKSVKFPTTHDFNELLRAWSKSGHVEAGPRAERAMRAISSFTRGKCKPNVYSYTIVITAYMQSSPATAGEKAFQLVRELERLAGAAPSQQAAAIYEPTLVTYAQVVKALSYSLSCRPDAAVFVQNGVLYVLDELQKKKNSFFDPHTWNKLQGSIRSMNNVDGLDQQMLLRRCQELERSFASQHQRHNQH